jgi:hypothetical protein
MRKRDFWAHLLADILARIGYFAITFAAVVFLAAGGIHRGAGGYSIEVLYAALALGALAALIGPSLYRQAIYRGRGTLSQVKRNSERRK